MINLKFEVPKPGEGSYIDFQVREGGPQVSVKFWPLKFLWMLVLGAWCFSVAGQEQLSDPATNSVALSATNGPAGRSVSIRPVSLIRSGPSADSLLSKPDEWFRSEAGRTATTNVLSWQSPIGDWPSNTRTPAAPFDGNREKLRGNFDNGATTGELRFLAKAFRVAQDTNCESAFLKGLDLILKAQYPTGGWPQNYPPDEQYHRHITFNDNAMIRLMKFLSDVATSSNYAFVDEARRKAAQVAFDRGIECILQCQIKVDGKLTVWCAQHDELDYSPRSGRKFELVSLSGSESAGILELLMSLDNPSPEVARAINAGAAWFETAKLKGIRFERNRTDGVVIEDTNAPPIWARFYEIESNRPIFSGRDSIKKYSVAEIELERRRGYSWYGPWGDDVATQYSRWKKKWSKLANEQSEKNR